MLSKWIYVLIGNNNTGKTTFQKRLIYHLCGVTYTRLDRNTIHEINRPNSPKKLKKLSTINRSYQESTTTARGGGLIYALEGALYNFSFNKIDY